MTQPKTDIRQNLVSGIDLPAALGLLTRLPIRVDTDRAMARGAAAAWVYPMAGIVIAALACAVTATALWLGLPYALAAALLLTTQIIITGAMHEDGLADTADGLWGGWTPERRLEIMKDSQIGTYGTIALVLSLLVRWTALTAILPHSLWAAALATAALSRAPMVIVMSALPNARTGGLSRSVGRPSGATAGLATTTAILATALLLGPGLTLTIALWLALATFACAVIARTKIRGQTGDILGATHQICEIIALSVLAAHLC